MLVHLHFSGSGVCWFWDVPFYAKSTSLYSFIVPPGVSHTSVMELYRQRKTIGCGFHCIAGKPNEVCFCLFDRVVCVMQFRQNARSQSPVVALTEILRNTQYLPRVTLPLYIILSITLLNDSVEPPLILGGRLVRSENFSNDRLVFSEIAICVSSEKRLNVDTKSCFSMFRLIIE